MSSGASALAPRGSRSASSSAATARHAAGSSTGGGQGETWAYYSTRNRLWLLQRLRGRATARREAANTSARALLRLREPIGRAKLEGVRDWARGRMGRGPYPR